MIKYIYLYPFFGITKGIKRSLILNLKKSDLYIISNDIYEIIQSNEINSNHPDFDKIEQLEEEGILIISDKREERFSDVKMSWSQPTNITNAIIEFDSFDLFYFQESISKILSIGCVNIEIRIYFNCNIEKLEKLLSLFSNTNISFLSIILSYNENLNQIESTCEKFLFLNNVLLINSPYSKVSNTKKIIYTEENISSKSCGNISPNNFVVNQEFYNESLSFNSCLYKKMTIDSKGNIKNCPAMNESFGNIKDLDIVLESDSFKEYWKLNKDNINICRDCEFRNICMDCRAFISDPLNIQSKPLKCGYNPYTSQWSNWKKNNFKIIEYYNL